MTTIIVRADAGGLGGFFKKDSSKQDAARKALEDALKGKKDPFAAAEERRKKSGGGDGGDGGGGGGGGGGFSFNFGDFSDGFRKWLITTGRTILAVLMFAGAISLFYLWRPVSQLLTALVRMLLRLDGNPRAQMAAQNTATPDFNKKDGLGNVEEAVISKYAGGDGSESDEYDTESGEE